MAYAELIKNFSRIRKYMREFYVYGFKSRNEYTDKSGRSYDNERRRVESWLGDQFAFRTGANGKRAFVSVDSRTIPKNPLFQAFKAKSFTANDLVLHFLLLDILATEAAAHGADTVTNGEDALTLRQIMETLSARYLPRMETDWQPDESTVRKKLKEYERIGVLRSEKRGRETAFRMVRDGVNLSVWREAISFFSEADPLGVIGSFFPEATLETLEAMPKVTEDDQTIRFKHHYILHTLDAEILYTLLDAITRRRCVELTVFSTRGRSVRVHTVCPLKIYISVQGGRQYLLCYHYRFRKPMFYRLDGVQTVKTGAAETQWARYYGFYEAFAKNLWGVSTGGGYTLDHIEMYIHAGETEGYIVDRLYREKRGGQVERIDAQTWRFSADVYDASELLPWIRTFTGRIAALKCGNTHVTDTFYTDLALMRAMYSCD